jgi:hypothetical protein
VVRALAGRKQAALARLDVTFRNDEPRMRIGHLARVFTLFRKTALDSDCFLACLHPVFLFQQVERAVVPPFDELLNR